jgi:hypothetical protein
LQELLYEMDYRYWAATSSNYRASFTSSWSGANGRKRKAAAERRAARAAAADGVGSAADARAASTRRGGKGKRSGRTLGWDDIDKVVWLL